MFKVSADGNCLYKACSLAAIDNEAAYILLRALKSVKLYFHADDNADAAHPYFISALAKEKTANVTEAMFCISLSHKATDLLPESSKNYSDCGHLEALRNCQNKRWSQFTVLTSESKSL